MVLPKTESMMNPRGASRTWLTNIPENENYLNTLANITQGNWRYLYNDDCKGHSPLSKFLFSGIQASTFWLLRLQNFKTHQQGK